MYSAAASSPGDGVARPCRVSDARNATSALRFSGRRCAAIREGRSCAIAAAANKQESPRLRNGIGHIITRGYNADDVDGDHARGESGAEPLRTDPPGTAADRYR